MIRLSIRLLAIALIVLLPACAKEAGMASAPPGETPMTQTASTCQVPTCCA